VAEARLQALSENRREEDQDEYLRAAGLDQSVLEGALDVARRTGQRHAEALYLEKMGYAWMAARYDIPDDATGTDLLKQALAICHGQGERP
jgi:hypothetical protein